MIELKEFYHVWKKGSREGIPLKTPIFHSPGVAQAPHIYKLGLLEQLREKINDYEHLIKDKAKNISEKRIYHSNYKFKNIRIEKISDRLRMEGNLNVD